MKTPKFLRKMMQSNAYTNRSNPDFAQTNEKVTEYLQMFYPGSMEFDATGKMKGPDYDMTLEQFEELQRKIQEELEERIAEIRRSLEDDDDNDEEESEDGGDGEGGDADSESYAKDKDKPEVEIRVFISEIIPVRVLLDEENEIIDLRNLEIFDIEIIEPDEDGDDPIPDPDPEKFYYVWSCNGDNPCEVCEEMDGTILDDDHVPKPHPNCNCEAIRMPGSEYKKKYGKPSAKKQQKYKELKEKEKVREMQLSEKGMEFLKGYENKVMVDGRHVIYDDATGKPVPEGQPLPPGATIGYGHLIKPGEDFSKGLTEKEAMDLFHQDVRAAENAVRNYIDVPISQNKFDALVSLTYNIGAGGLKESTIRQYVNNPNFKSNAYPTPESAWKAWNKTQGKVSNGLINRRNDEWNLFIAND